MEKKTKRTWEYFKTIIFVLLLAELFLLFVAIIFGRSPGHEFVEPVCFWLGIIVSAVFASIVFANVAAVFFFHRYRKAKRSTKEF